MADAQSASPHPFEFLLGLERRARAHGAEVPGREERRDEWRGVGFRLGGQRFVAPLGEVVEILNPPRVARVPHSKGWVHGVANVRGNLLPIMDLNNYLGKGPIALNRLSRVLVVERQLVFTGLLVDEVLGMCHFLFPEQWRPVVDDGKESAAPYLNGVLQREGSDWLVFSPARLVNHPQFLKVAA